MPIVVLLVGGIGLRPESLPDGFYAGLWRGASDRAEASAHADERPAWQGSRDQLPWLRAREGQLRDSASRAGSAANSGCQVPRHHDDLGGVAGHDLGLGEDQLNGPRRLIRRVPVRQQQPLDRGAELRPDLLLH